MKILLIDPPDIYHAYGNIDKKMKQFAPTLGLSYIAAVLLENNITIKYLDARGEGMTLDQIGNVVKEYKPDAVAITCMTTAYGITVKISELIKEISKDIKVILGGPHVTPTAEEIIREKPCVDIAVVGEGEYTMLEIAQGQDLKDIKGIVYRENEQVKINEPRPLIEDIDSLPFPARHLYNMDNFQQPLYEAYGKPLGTIVTSRGCPFDCSFCSSKVTFTRRVRFRSADAVIAEIDHLIEKYNIKGIKINDDTFTLNRDRLKKICLAIKERGLYWIGNARVETLNNDILAFMKDCNCRLLLFGIESGDPAVQHELKNAENLELAQRVFKWTNELKIDTVATFIFGSPSETEQSVENTIKFVCEARPTFANFFILSPYPGTEIYEYMKKHDMMKINDWMEVQSPKYENYIIKHPLFSAEELKQMQKRAYRKFYLTPGYALATIKKIDSWHKLRLYTRLASKALPFMFQKKMMMSNLSNRATIKKAASYIRGS